MYSKPIKEVDRAPPCPGSDLIGMSRSFVRSFASEVGNRIEQLRGSADTQVEILGVLQYSDNRLPFYQVKITNPVNTNLPCVLLSAGTHGNEAAGVFAILEFLEKHVQRYSDRYNFLVFPCINPSGFELNQRCTRSNYDLNRMICESSQAPEAGLFVNAIESDKRNYLFAIDLHESLPEDVEIMAQQGEITHFVPPEFFMYEVCPDHSRRIGDRIISKLEVEFPICKLPIIQGDLNSGGVIWYPEGCASEVYLNANTLDLYLSRRACSHVFVTESSTAWSLEQRILIQLGVIQEALNQATQ